jgi:hypothetical protein
MKKLTYLLVILLTLFFLVELRASTLQRSIIPEEADWVIHFDVEKLKSTPYGEHLLDTENILGLRKKNAQFQDHYQINILEDIKGVTVYGYGKDEENTVLCLQGTFDQEYLLGLLADEESHREIQHNTFIIHRWDHHEFGVFVNDNLALLAQDETAIKKALDVISGKNPNVSSSSLMSYVNKITPDVFFAAMAKDISKMAEHESDVFIFRKAESALFTLTDEKDNINLRLDFIVKTLEDAKNMESVIRGLVSLASMQLEESQRNILLPLEKMVIFTEGKNIRIELSYPAQDLIDILLGKKHIFLLHKLAGVDLHP